MSPRERPDSDSKALWERVHQQIARHEITLGTATAATYVTDAKMVAFMAARYKFVAKMLEGHAAVLEIGCGDAFGAPLVAQAVGHLICTDVHEGTLADNRQRLTVFKNIDFQYFDFRVSSFPTTFDAAFAIDVLEHIYP